MCAPHKQHGWRPTTNRTLVRTALVQPTLTFVPDRQVANGQNLVDTAVFGQEANAEPPRLVTHPGALDGRRPPVAHAILLDPRQMRRSPQHQRVGLELSADVLDSVRIKVKKAYPSYFGSYYELDKVKTFLDSIENLWCIGRNGQHRYNNMDHSMMTAMVTVDHIAAGNQSKSEVWSVNTEEEYHESK